MQVHYDEDRGEHWVDPKEAEQAEADFEELVREVALIATRRVFAAAKTAGVDPSYLHERALDAMQGADIWDAAMKAEGLKPSLTTQSIAQVTRLECERLKREHS